MTLTKLLVSSTTPPQKRCKRRCTQKVKTQEDDHIAHRPLDIKRLKNQSRHLWQRTQIPFNKTQYNKYNRMVKLELDNLRINNYLKE